MDAYRWLLRHAPGFDELTAAERKAVRDFALLWSLFESVVLETNASADKIVNVSEKQVRRGAWTIAAVALPLAHFRARYYDGTDLTAAFHHLHLRKNDQPAMIETVLRGVNVDVADTLAALLIIVLRLRNNLFHGVKWSYGLKGQSPNFQSANRALTALLEVHQP
jgi:hypothetical protein